MAKIDFVSIVPNIFNSPLNQHDIIKSFSKEIISIFGVKREDEIVNYVVKNKQYLLNSLLNIVYNNSILIVGFGLINYDSIEFIDNKFSQEEKSAIINILIEYSIRTNKNHPIKKYNEELETNFGSFGSKNNFKTINVDGNTLYVLFCNGSTMLMSDEKFFSLSKSLEIDLYKSKKELVNDLKSKYSKILLNGTSEEDFINNLNNFFSIKNINLSSIFFVHNIESVEDIWALLEGDILFDTSYQKAIFYDEILFFFNFYNSIDYDCKIMYKNTSCIEEVKGLLNDDICTLNSLFEYNKDKIQEQLISYLEKNGIVHEECIRVYLKNFFNSNGFIQTQTDGLVELTFDKILNQLIVSQPVNISGIYTYFRVKIKNIYYYYYYQQNGSKVFMTKEMIDNQCQSSSDFLTYSVTDGTNYIRSLLSSLDLAFGNYSLNSKSLDGIIKISKKYGLKIFTKSDIYSLLYSIENNNSDKIFIGVKLILEIIIFDIYNFIEDKKISKNIDDELSFLSYKKQSLFTNTKVDMSKFVNYLCLFLESSGIKFSEKELIEIFSKTFDNGEKIDFKIGFIISNLFDNLKYSNYVEYINTDENSNLIAKEIKLGNKKLVHLSVMGSNKPNSNLINEFWFSYESFIHFQQVNGYCFIENTQTAIKYISKKIESILSSGIQWSKLLKLINGNGLLYVNGNQLKIVFHSFFNKSFYDPVENSYEKFNFHFFIGTLEYFCANNTSSDSMVYLKNIISILNKYENSILKCSFN